MGLEGGGKTDIAQQDADAGSFQAEATGLLHAGQAKLAHGHDATAKPTSPKPRDSADRLESGVLPGLNTDHLHNSTRELLFQHNSHGVPVAFQPHNDVTTVGLPQINIFNSSNQTELHTGVKNNLAPHDNETAPPHDTPPAPTDGKQPSPQNGETKVENYAVKKGDSLWKIAREHLPKGASNRIIANYVHQIEADNPMHDPNLIMPGQIIKLRGYAPPAEHDTAHGAEHHGMPEHYHSNHKVHRTETGGRNYSYPRDNDGRRDSENRHDSNSNNHQPLPDTANHKDSPPPDGQSPVVPSDQNKPTQKPGIVPDKDLSSNVEQEKHKLLDAAHEVHADIAGLKQDMSRFENVIMSKEEQRLIKSGMSAEAARSTIDKEIAGTYEQVDKLYEIKPKDKEQAWHLHTAAREIIHNAGNADNIHQGKHNTCGATAVESMTYMTHPSQAAKLVADVVTTGQYTTVTPNGKITVNIDTAPHDGSHMPMHNGRRNYASELFQVTANNLAWAEKDPGVQYVQKESRWRASTHPTGEYLLKNDKDLRYANGKLVSPPDITPKDASVMYSLINHTAEAPIVIDRGHYNDPLVIDVNSPQQFNQLLKDRVEHRGLPVILDVNSTDKLFSKDNPDPGGHAILITDYVPAHDEIPASITYCNWWSTETTDQTVSSKDLYDALLKLRE